MIIRTIFAAALFALGLFSFSSEARADYLVICPTGSISASWEHTQGFGDTGPFQVRAQRELQLFQTRVLRCDVNLGFFPSFSYASDGDCGGTVEYLGFSAVFGRNEIFSSGKLEAEPTPAEQGCVLNGPSFFVISMTMSEECTPLSQGDGWTCPDSATEVSAP